MAGSATVRFAGEQGLRSFRDTVTASLVPQDIRPSTSEFRAQLRSTSCSGVTILQTRISPVRSLRANDFDTADDGVFLLTALDGGGVLGHRGGTETVENGVTVVIPAGEGFDVTYGRPACLLFLAIPGALVDDSFRRLRGPIRSVRFGPVGSVLLPAVAQILTDDADMAAAPVVRSVIELCLGHVDDGPGSALRMRADRLIDQYLGDPRLDVVQLARLLLTSPRSLERAFAGQGVANHLRGRRLDAAARRLRDRPPPTVAQVAADLGFASASAFAAHFRRRFGVTPSDWR